jgi:hypothetical protein
MLAGMFPPVASSLGAEAPAGPASDHSVLRAVASREDWAAVRALRFGALARGGDVPACAVPAYGDEHDAMAGSITYLLLDRGRAIGSTRCIHSGAGSPLPAIETFRAELDPGSAAARAVEASLTVIDAPADRAAAMLHLFKVHMTACAALEAEWLLAAVRETEMGFYRRVFDMEILTGALRCPGLAMPRVLMGLAWRERAAALLRRLPMLAASGSDLRRFAALAVAAPPDEACRPPLRAAAGDACG